MTPYKLLIASAAIASLCLSAFSAYPGQHTAQEVNLVVDWEQKKKGASADYEFDEAGSIDPARHLEYVEVLRRRLRTRKPRLFYEKHRT